MSAVTKVLIVVLVVLCVAFSMSAISFVAQSVNWKSLAGDYRNQAQVADAAQRNQMAIHAAELAAARDTIRQRDERLNGLQVELADSAEQSATLANQVAQVEADKRQADALAQRLTNELSIAQAARQAIEEQRSQFERRNIELERRNVDLNERVNELTTRVTVMEQQQRQQAQQLAMLRTENKQLAERAGVTATGAGLAPGGGELGLAGVRPAAAQVPKISGKVLAVEGPIVTISVGSADQVHKGDVFIISRNGSQYVGDISISDVEPDIAAGRVVRTAEGMSPQPGDEVHNEQQFVSPD